MGLFSPIVRVDDDGHDFSWILEILNRYPDASVFEKQISQLNAAITRAEAARLYIEKALTDATKTAKEELRSEIQTALSECQSIQREIDAAKQEILATLDDSVEVAKSELLNLFNSEIGKAETFANNAANSAENAQAVVNTAIESLRSENNVLVENAVNEELVKAKTELQDEVNTLTSSCLSEINLAKSNLQALINNKTMELNSAINEKLQETKDLIELENDNAVDEVKEYINTNPFYKRGSFILIPENWIGGEQTVSVTGVKTDSDIIVTHAPESYALYIAHGIHLVEVETGLLRFACEAVPTSSITVNVMIMLRGAEL